MLVANRLADVALGPNVASGPYQELTSEPIFRCSLIVVAAKDFASTAGAAAGARHWTWLIDPSGTEPGGDVDTLLRQVRVPEGRVRVFANQTAAWAAAADGAGVAPATAHLVSHRLRRGELSVVDVGVPPVDAGWYATMPGPGRRTPAAAGCAASWALPRRCG